MPVTGMVTMVARVTLASLRVNFHSQGLMYLVLSDNFQSNWLKAVLSKLHLPGISPQAILVLNWDQKEKNNGQRDTV